MTAAARTPESFSPDFIRRLEAALGRPIVEPADAAAYLTDWRGFLTAHNAIVVRPGSTEEVSKVVKVCAEARVPIVPQGGNTGLTGGSIPYEQEAAVVVNLGRMNKVRRDRVARKRRAIDHEHLVALAGQQHRRGRSGAAGAHYDHVVLAGHVVLLDRRPEERL